MKLGETMDQGSCSDATRALQQLSRVSGIAVNELLTRQITLSETGIDPRLRMLKPEPRPYPILRVITASDLAAGRGLEDCLSIFHDFDRKRIQWQWYILGDALDHDYLVKLTNRFENEGWEENITLCGPYQLDKFIHLAMNMDLGLYPSSQDPLRICEWEARQLGLPIHSELEEADIFKLASREQTLRLSHDFSTKKTWRELAISAGILLD